MVGLSGIVALSAFDRLSIAPLLISVAISLHTSPSMITLVAAVNFVTYGLSQVGHGWLSDRIGRARTLRIALGVMGVANLVACVAPTALVLLLARAVDGAASGGLVPGALVLLADQNLGPKIARRQAALMMALGGGTAITALVGLASGAHAWRTIFGITALACFALIVMLPANVVPDSSIQHTGVLGVLTQPQVTFVTLIAIPEGAAVFGFVVFFAPTLEHAGWPPRIPALATGAVGPAMMLGGTVVRPLTARVRDAHLLRAGALCMTLGYVLAIDHALVAIIIAATLVGAGQAGVHATLQRWATLAAPHARGVSTALFASGAFIGAALAASMGAVLPSQFTMLYITGAVCSLFSGLVAARHSPPTVTAAQSTSHPFHQER